MTTINQPIGIFDSGVGGLTILKSLLQQAPEEAYIYLADSGYAPYGDRDKEYIIHRAGLVTDFLLNRGAKLIVIACNTATGAAITTLRNRYDVPFVGVEPAVKPAALRSKTGHIGVLATRQTFQGEHFQRTAGLHAREIEVHVQEGQGLVEWIESGMEDEDWIRQQLSGYLVPLLEQNIDQLVLGCTHYPWLISYMKQLLPESIEIHDPAPAVARQVLRVLQSYHLYRLPGVSVAPQFYTTGQAGFLNRFVKEHLNLNAQSGTISLS